MAVSIIRHGTGDERTEGLWADVLQAFGLRRIERDDSVQYTRVLVQPQNGKYLQGEISLPDFVHPENAEYIFGPDDAHLDEAEYDVSVHIPVADGVASTLWSHQAALIVLYDRKTKRGDTR